MKDQGQIFRQSEADKWFQRNLQGMTGEEKDDLVLDILQENSVQPKKVLEIGCSNGYRLHRLSSIYNAKVFGVEPSGQAIQDGQKRFPEINFTQGLAHDLSVFPDAHFDLVIIYFVFHWVDRSFLLKSVTEIDRVLQKEGYLVVGDFAPDTPSKVAYHHLPEEEVFTYKQHYAGLFTKAALYKEVAEWEFDHRDMSRGEAIESSHRSTVTLLQRILENSYSVMNLS